MKLSVHQSHDCRRVLLPFIPLVLLAVHCGSSDSDDAMGGSGSGGWAGGGYGGSGGALADGGDAACSEGDYVCEGTVAWRCDANGGHVDPVDCADDNLICTSGYGCVTCVPGATSCSEGIGTYCSDDGSEETSFVCDPKQGMECTADGCEGACIPQKIGRKHTGCDFWPTVTANPAWSDWFAFGVMVVNTSEEDAHIIVTRGDETIAERTVAGSGVEIVELPWVDSLKGPDADDGGTVTPPSASVLSSTQDGGGAYRLRSDHPVVVTQFNTLQGSNEEGPNQGCPASNEGTCLSYSNEASLLMPAHALDSTYLLMGWRAWQDKGIGDFVTITATNDDTEVEVSASSPGLALEGGEPFEPGEPYTFSLSEGDVLQLFTDASVGGAQWAGAELNANYPVQVLTGAPCVNVPESAPTCDHLEETNLPSKMLGKRYMVMAASAPNERLRHVVRIHGVEDDTVVEFDPAGVHAAVTLNRGEVVDLDLPKDAEPTPESADFLLSSTRVFGVTQYMVGNQAEPYDPYATDADLGDPSQTFVVPTSRYLKRYEVALAPGFEQHRLDIMAATGAEVLLDDEPISSESFQAIGASGMSVTRVTGLEAGTRHVLRSDQPFGVQIRGFGPFTSYMVPGGVDLRLPSQ